MSDKTPLDQLQYKYNTLKIISAALLCMVALSFAACVIMYDTKEMVKEHNEWQHKQLMECIKNK